MLKKSLLLSLLLSQWLFAGSMDAGCEPGAACQNAAWAVAAKALYLRPSFGGNSLGYSTFSNYGFDNFGNVIEVNGASNNIHNLKPDWGWGFELEGQYLFNPNNDFTLQWYHNHRHTSGHFPAGTLFAGSAVNLYAGKLKIAPRWDAIHLELGQKLQYLTGVDTRIHVGVAFAAIKNTFTNYPQLLPTSTPVFITEDTNRFNGFGPRIGIDFDYFFHKHFSLYAKAAGSLLLGKTKQSVAGYQNLPSFTKNPFPNPYSTGNYVQSNEGLIIPGLEGKLGATYTLNLASGSLQCDLGYLWIDYLNVLVSQVGAGVVSSAISTSVAANFNLNGLYFGAKWMANP